MVIDIDYDALCQNAQRVTRLELDPRLPRVVAARGALERLGQWKSTAQPHLPERTGRMDTGDETEFLRTGRLGVTLNPDAIRPGVEDAFRSGTPLTAIPKALDRVLARYRSECDAQVPAMALTLDPTPVTLNPYDSVATHIALRERLIAIREAALSEKDRAAEQAAQSLSSFERLAPAIDTQIVSARPGSEQQRWRAVLDHWPIWLAPVVAIALPLLNGQDSWTVALFAFIGITIGGALDWWRSHRQKSTSANSGPLRIARPAIDLLISYLAASYKSYTHEVEARHASALLQQIQTNEDSRLAEIETEVAAQTADLPGSTFIEAHPCRILLTGSALANSVLAARRDHIGNIPASAAESASTLIGAAAEALGPVSLSEAVGIAVANARIAQELEFHLKQNLELLARHAVTIRSDISVDRTLCPEFLSIGLPDGDKDALVPLVRRTFPGSSIVQASTEAIEIIYRVHNLSRDHLAIHARSKDAYTRATGLERRLWHFPRRLTALSGETDVITSIESKQAN